MRIYLVEDYTWGSILRHDLEQSFIARNLKDKVEAKLISEGYLSIVDEESVGKKPFRLFVISNKQYGEIKSKIARIGETPTEGKVLSNEILDTIESGLVEAFDLEIAKSILNDRKLLDPDFSEQTSQGVINLIILSSESFSELKKDLNSLLKTSVGEEKNKIAKRILDTLNHKK